MFSFETRFIEIFKEKKTTINNYVPHPTINSVPRQLILVFLSYYVTIRAHKTIGYFKTMFKIKPCVKDPSVVK